MSGGRGCVIFRTACPGKAPEKTVIFCEKETHSMFYRPWQTVRPDPARSAALSAAIIPLAPPPMIKTFMRVLRC